MKQIWNKKASINMIIKAVSLVLILSSLGLASSRMSNPSMIGNVWGSQNSTVQNSLLLSQSFDFLEALPEARRVAYAKAQQGWDSGVTTEMIQANAELIDFYRESWLSIAELYLASDLSSEGATVFMDVYIQQRRSYHKAELVFENNQPGMDEPEMSAEMIAVLQDGSVFEDLQGLIADTVFSFAFDSDSFDYASWEGEWYEYLLN